MTNLATQLSHRFPELPWQFQYPLAAQTYFKIGGPAEAYLALSDRQDIINLVRFCAAERIKITILGGASNVIVADEGVSGVVLHLTNHQFDTTNEVIGANKRIIRAGAGIKTALLVRKTVDAGYTGLEYFLGVPGTLGGAVYNNAHYLADLIGQHIFRVEVIDRQGQVNWIEHAACEFGYDSSRFQRTHEIILNVELALAPGDSVSSSRLIKEATEYRARTQPLGIPSSGCIFQNVPNTPELQRRFPQFADRAHVPGGFLIDQAGLKGERVGDIEVSEVHGAFMVNRGRGTAAELSQLISLVKQRVKEAFGVELDEEVFYLR